MIEGICLALKAYTLKARNPKTLNPQAAKCLGALNPPNRNPKLLRL